MSDANDIKVNEPKRSVTVLPPLKYMFHCAIQSSYITI